MSRVLREPLLHFLILGVLVFAAYEWFGDNRRADEIVVTRGQQDNLIGLFERTWQRAPTAEEFRGLVEDHVRQEIAYREGLALELDRNDVIIRRRLRQKLELLTEDLATLAPPGDADLQAYYDTHAERFRTEARFTFEQIYFSPDRRGERAEADAMALLARLQDDAVPLDHSEAGDATLLPSHLEDARAGDVAATFGEDFAARLEQLEPGAWSGPVASAFGLHLVRLEQRSASRIPPFSEVSATVRAEWAAEQRRAAVDALYQRLAENYVIRIEPMVEDGGQAAGAVE